MPIFNRILLTGAAGRLGTQLRRGLAPMTAHLRLADRVPCTDLAPNEENVVFDLADMDATMAACEGCDAIVHFGGAADEQPWQTVLDSSIRGSYHIYEGARRHNVPRIVYSSSVHAIGFHRLDAHIGTDAPHRPDGLYGLSKCFVEDLARLYWDKFGIETACLRIFSSFDEPTDRRHLWSYLSFDDCNRLVESALTAPAVGFSVIFGMSDNRIQPVDNSGGAHLGFVPEDSSEPYRAAVERAVGPTPPTAIRSTRLGGHFCEMPHPDD